MTMTSGMIVVILQRPHDRQDCSGHSIESTRRGGRPMKRLRGMSVSIVALTAIAGPPALGADLITKAPVAPPVYAPPQFNWTGWYFGGNVGGGWTQGTVIDTTTGGSFGAGNQGTFIGGGQAGFNYQIGNAVFGVEGFFDGIARNNNNASTILTGM